MLTVNIFKKVLATGITLFMFLIIMLHFSIGASALSNTKEINSNISNYDIALSGIMSNSQIDNNIINTTKESSTFQHGVFISKKSQQSILNIINSISNKKFTVDSFNYLTANSNIEDSTKSSTVSKKISDLISGKQTFILVVDDGWWKINQDGQYEKQKFQKENSVRFNNKNITLIIFNSKYYNDCNIDKSIDFISDIFHETTTKKIIEEELSDIQSLEEATDNPISADGITSTTSTDNKNIENISSSNDQKNITFLFKDAKNRLNKRLKEQSSYNGSSSNYGIQTNSIAISTTKVYGGPGSIAYAQIGSLSTGDIYEVMYNEFGWQYVLYSTSAGYKCGYISGGTENVYPSIYSTGSEGTMDSKQTVYAGPSNSGYATIGSVSLNEKITILAETSTDDYAYIEYSSSSGTKRGYVPASSITSNYYSALAKMCCNSSVYSGPEIFYHTTGVINLEEYVAVIEKNDTFAFVEYNTKSGRKRAYIQLSKLQILNTTTTIPDITITGAYVATRMRSDTDVYGGPSDVNYAKIGSVDSDESVGVINKENGWFYIQYYTSNGPKRGYVKCSMVYSDGYISDKVDEKSGTYYGNNNSSYTNANIYAGPSETYATIGSVFGYEGLTQFTLQENSFYFIEYSTSSGTKRGYIRDSDLSGRSEGGLAIVSQDNVSTYYGPDFTDSLNLSLGSVWSDEYITVIQKNNEKSYIEYNTLSGRKRGYVSNSGLIFLNQTGIPALNNYTESLYSSLQTTKVYSGPDDNYASVGTIGIGENVTVFDNNVYGYSYIRYSTNSGFKRGYVPNSLLELFVYSVSIPEINLANVTKGIYGYSGQGRELAYYKIGQGNNHMILNFCIHGFEDHWAHDGYELVLTAQQLLNQLNDKIETINNKDWSVYVILSSNPDGLLDGTTENGPGRCSTTMLNDDGSVTSNHGLDINRSFPKYFIQYTSDRNFTGPHSLMSKESVALKDFIQNNKSSSGNNVFIDAHGWLNEVIVSNKTGSIYQELINQFPGCGYENVMETNKHGFVSTWATSIGYDGALFEFPSDVWSHTDMINKRYQQCYINAIINMISNYHAQ